MLEWKTSPLNHNTYNEVQSERKIYEKKLQKKAKDSRQHIETIQHLSFISQIQPMPGIYCQIKYLVLREFRLLFS